jgi:hypothetical protein
MGLLDRVLPARRNQADEQPTTDAPAAATADGDVPEPTWRTRGRLRRRLRYVRRAREVALRDLGGLVFDLHRFERERPDLVAAKLEALGALDRERRALEAALDDVRGLDVLREPGLASCPQCGSLHGSDARFCPGCGQALAEREQPPAAAQAEAVAGAAAATSDTPGT